MAFHHFENIKQFSPHINDQHKHKIRLESGFWKKRDQYRNLILDKSQRGRSPEIRMKDSSRRWISTHWWHCSQSQDRRVFPAPWIRFLESFWMIENNLNSFKNFNVRSWDVAHRQRFCLAQWKWRQIWIRHNNKFMHSEVKSLNTVRPELVKYFQNLRQPIPNYVWKVKYNVPKFRNWEFLPHVHERRMWNTVPLKCYKTVRTLRNLKITLTILRNIFLYHEFVYFVEHSTLPLVEIIGVCSRSNFIRLSSPVPLWRRNAWTGIFRYLRA